MKAYTASDRNGDEGITLVIFAESAGKAKAYAAQDDRFCDYGFTGIRVNRCKSLDQFYKGRPEMDWFDMDDRIAMVRYADFRCSTELSDYECHCEICTARKWCGRYDLMMEGEG